MEWIHIHSALRDQIRKMCSARISNEIVVAKDSSACHVAEMAICEYVTLIEYGLWKFKFLERRPPETRNIKESRGEPLNPNCTNIRLQIFSEIYETNSGNPSAENVRMDISIH